MYIHTPHALCSVPYMPFGTQRVPKSLRAIAKQCRGRMTNMRKEPAVPPDSVIQEHCCQAVGLGSFQWVLAWHEIGALSSFWTGTTADSGRRADDMVTLSMDPPPPRIYLVDFISYYLVITYLLSNNLIVS